ncbi:MAG TPA: MlaD family protein [Bacteroidales bacterium]|nr:MlaD family protein [Bacteroidales bacterium]
MKITREFKIGIVAVIAIVLTIWGINFLKGINVLKPTDKYYAVYNNVKGLIESAVVYLNGYKVGNVTGIAFDRNNMNKIVVQISLHQKLKLPRNTALVIRSASLISGTKDLDLVPGNEPGFHESGDTLVSLLQVELTDYIDPIRHQVESLVTSMDTLMVSLNGLMDEKTRANMQGAIANLNGALGSLRLSLQSTGSLSESMDNLASFTGNLEKNNERISAILENFGAISDTLKQADLKALINNADVTFAKTAELFDQINKGNGTAGQLITNDSLYNNLNSALASLDSLLTDLREHPKRYVHLSVFGKKDK